MPSWLRKVVKIALGLTATGMLLVLAAIVGFRVLVTQLPSYQDDLQVWVNRELGLQLTFARLDARLSWRGPELTFHDASVAADASAAPFLTARTASVGSSPLQLLARVVTRRELGVDRLVFEGTELTVVRTADGAYRLQGAPNAATRVQDFRLDVPPEVEVLVRDSRVLYLDQSRGIAWSFQDVDGSMRRVTGALELAARARPPRELASTVSLTAQGFIGDGASPAPLGTAPTAAGVAQRSDGVQFTGDWRVSADVADADLAMVARLLPDSAVVPQAGNGDVGVWLEWRSRELVGGTVDLALDDVAVPTVLGTAGARYERIALKGDWQRDGREWHVALRDVGVTREGRAWPTGSGAEIEVARDAAGELIPVALKSDFMRLEDLTPFLSPLPESRALESWFALAPRGDLRAASVELEKRDDALDYTVAAQFTGLGIETLEGLPGFDGLTGEVRADRRSGRIALRSTDASVDWPTLFRAPLALDAATGIVVWREGQDAVRVVSDDLVVATPDASTRSNLELTLPLDGSSPLLDLETAVSTFAVGAVQKYLPAHKMPPTVVGWLDSALQGGLVREGSVRFLGPLHAFPFDAGEGEFRAVASVEGGRLAYLRDWPWAEELDGTVEFVNAGFSARGSGRTLGNRTSDVQVKIPDLRAAVFDMKLDTIGPLGQVLEYLQSAPLIARHLGPDFARLEAANGTGEVSVDLSLPLRDRAKYDLQASLGIIDGELSFRGFVPHATEIEGSLALDGGTLSGEGIRAIFLDGPVTARVDSPNIAGYRARIALEGEVTIDAVVDAFNLPYADYFAGQTRWEGRLLIPAAEAAVRPPPRIVVDSNLSGVALRLPAPFAKAPSEPTNLEVELVFPASGGLEMQGYLGASRRFALDFAADSSGAEGKFEFRRAALRFGGALPELRSERGVTVDGTVAELNVDEWLALPRSGAVAAGGPTGSGQWTGAFAGAELDVAELTAFGQKLGATKVSARRRTDDWQIELDSNPVAGTLLVPVDLGAEPQIVAVMRRLYLAAGGEGSMAKVDPRNLPGLQLHADEFAIGQRQLGRLDAEILSDPLGLRLVSFESAAESFSAQGSGGWFTGADGDTTRIAMSLTSSDVAKTLDQLGFDPIVQAEGLDVTASVYWPGPPSGDWLDHVGGDFALRASKGSLVDVQPGAGRVVGLLSISALPRRLALDFRDVFNRGLVFDEINADFVVIDGNAYTDNLKLTGPVAEIGVIGRTGLRDRDYRQQAVVTAEPGKVLPTVGGLLGGPAVAAALLIFTRIFKEPLKGIGRASYCVSGSWQDPMVERLSQEQLDQGEICAELPPNGTLGAPAGVAAR
jgi:uncharacterized protein (TIGR02099 family)